MYRITLRFENKALEPLVTLAPAPPEFQGSWAIVTSDDHGRVAFPEGRLTSLTWEELP
jgi:hypothetical protein